MGFQSVFLEAESLPQIDVLGSTDNLLLAISSHTQKGVALFQQLCWLGEKSQFIAFANVCGVNILNMADFSYQCVFTWLAFSRNLTTSSQEHTY